MARQNIRLLGSFQVEVEGQNVTGFELKKVRGLFAILAAEYDRAYTRLVLAEML